MKKRIIIEFNDYEMTDGIAMEFVEKVVEQGKTSGEHYCWHTVFRWWPDTDLHVSARRKRSKNAADSFVLWTSEHTGWEREGT